MLRTVTSPAVAAALATHGIPFTISRLLDERSGRENLTFEFAMRSTCGEHITGRLVLDHEEGKLSSTSPFSLILRAIEARDSLTKSTSPLLRFLPGIPVGIPAFRTTDPAAAAILHVLGHVLGNAEGTPPSRWTFRVPSPGDPGGDVIPAILARRNGTLDPDHIVSWLFTGLDNHDELRRMVSARKRRVLLRPPGPFARHATVPETATARQLDEVRRFLAV